jgi:hypothetical protein
MPISDPKTPASLAWSNHLDTLSDASEVRLVGQVLTRLVKGTHNTADKALIKVWGLGLALESAGIEDASYTQICEYLRDRVNLIKPSKGSKGDRSEPKGSVDLYAANWTSVKAKISEGEAPALVYHVLSELVGLAGKAGKVEVFKSQGVLYVSFRYVSKTGASKVETCKLTETGITNLKGVVQRDVRAFSTNEIRAHKIAVKLAKGSELSESEKKFNAAHGEMVVDAQQVLKAQKELTK